jgi:hypothetical protein
MWGESDMGWADIGPINHCDRMLTQHRRKNTLFTIERDAAAFTYQVEAVERSRGSITSRDFCEGREPFFLRVAMAADKEWKFLRPSRIMDIQFPLEFGGASHRFVAES